MLVHFRCTKTFYMSKEICHILTKQNLEILTYKEVTKSVYFLLNIITKCIVGNRNNISASNKAVTNILPLFP